MGQERERRAGIWKRWAPLALAIAAGAALSDLAWDRFFGDDVEHPMLYLVFGTIVGFVVFFGAFAFAELWSRHRGSDSLNMVSHLPLMPSMAWVQSAFIEADRDCVVDSSHGDDRHVIANGRWNRWTSRKFQLTIDAAEDCYRAVIWSAVPPRIFDRGKTEALVARAHAALRWRCEETAGV
jgi:hypothetical protein